MLDNQDSAVAVVPADATVNAKPGIVIAAASAVAFVAGAGVSWFFKGRRQAKEMQELREQLEVVKGNIHAPTSETEAAS